MDYEQNMNANTEHEKERYGMPQVTISSQRQILPASKLRTLSQGELLKLLKEEHALGLFFNNEWAATVVEQTTFEEMRKSMEEMSARLEQLEDLLAEVQVYQQRMNTPKEKRLQKPANMSMYEWLQSQNSEE